VPLDPEVALALLARTAKKSCRRSNSTRSSGVRLGLAMLFGGCAVATALVIANSARLKQLQSRTQVAASHAGWPRSRAARAPPSRKPASASRMIGPPPGRPAPPATLGYTVAEAADKVGIGIGIGRNQMYQAIARGDVEVERWNKRIIVKRVPPHRQFGAPDD
jgi:hypothetical protein